MRIAITLAVVAVTCTSVMGGAMDEVNEWRKRCGLKPFVEDPEMTKFAVMKARYRAERNLRDGHQGPQPKAGWHEGTGEALPMWGWLTCEMESDFKYAGAGMCVGNDGTRYMVLVCRSGSGRALVRRNYAPVHNTSYLTPNPPRLAERIRRVTKKIVTPKLPAKSNATVNKVPSKRSRVITNSSKRRCPKCGKFH